MKIHTVVCPYCSEKAKLVDSACVYGKSYGLIYLCKPCDAYVGVHKGTNTPLGRLANKDLRSWKMKAHAAFDPLWQRKLGIKLSQDPHYKKKFARGSGYNWLSQQMGLTRQECHIGMFDIEQCKKVIEVCSPFKLGAK
ncbi:zinc-finger-containing protein [Dyadobacter sp. CY356]|uniref:zinc-finger-containing protein n=1 Tax=Dyadobacter sp. CY356 TaxID=2906442 RepID=UPI001F1E6864|nr:zinc-finger-containing protein [Dyadobacter sp. CY356]MCF0055541.1 DUF3268 family zinc-finger domain-containing protein [Dyadobacter sp. CY356]